MTDTAGVLSKVLGFLNGEITGIGEKKLQELANFWKPNLLGLLLFSFTAGHTVGDFKPSPVQGPDLSNLAQVCVQILLCGVSTIGLLDAANSCYRNITNSCRDELRATVRVGT